MKLFVFINIFAPVVGFVVFAFHPIEWTLFGHGSYLFSFWVDGLIGAVAMEFVLYHRRLLKVIRKIKNRGSD